MINQANEVKLAVSGILAALTALWGWFGWLVVLWIGCMVADYLTGTLAACRVGKWDSTVARDGIWHKLGSIVAVLVAAGADMAVGMVANNIPQVSLPFEYTVFLCPLVLVWYIVTELGSICENAGKMGAPLPSFLQRILALFGEGIEAAGDRVAGVEKKE